MSVAYLGPAGTFTHLACLQRFGESDARPVHSIKAVFEAVTQGQVDCGVVPVENSLEGIVNHTLDLFVDSPLFICGEILQEISHFLMSKTGNKEDVQTIYSHPQAIAQCSRFLVENFPVVPMVEVGSTAIAAHKAAHEKSAAAIASSVAAQYYGLEIIAGQIEDSPNNVTRFLVISKLPAKKGHQDKTSLLLSIKDRSGGLCEILKPFAEQGINLTKIESRPSKKKPWEYLFYMDVLGHQDDEKMQIALGQMKENTIFIRVLGSYPVAEAMKSRHT
jgi:chorismate mutase/prephenate dehydratase